MKKIMIIEDNEGILDALKIMLEMYDYEVIQSPRWKGLVDLEKESPDLILLDYWLSESNGKNICREIKSNDATKEIPVLIISASKDVELIAKEAGADGYIAKPFEMDDLINIVGQHISKVESQD